MTRRTPVQLLGGPFNGDICFAPAGAVGLDLERQGRWHTYRIDGTLGIYLGPLTLAEVTRECPPRPDLEN